jgi:tRNA (guanine37-N1)-methyltransferase
MLTAKSPLKKAEQVKKFLIQKRLYDNDYVIDKSKRFIYFPIKKRAGIKRKFSFVDIIDRNLRKTKKQTPRASLQNILTEKELQLLGTSFDVVGNILILELPKRLEKKEKHIAKAFLNLKNIHTIVKKSSPHKGKLRLQKYKILAGKRKKETMHRENNALIKLNIDQTYFSPRLATERLRIAKLVKPKESVLVMFSGCAPYVLVIAKNSKPKMIHGIEINKKAHAYALENIKLNKIRNATLMHGDVNKIMPKLNKRFDRIVMPLPKTAQDFLDVALKASKKGTIIHFYDFSREENFPEYSINKIKKACKKLNKKFSIINSVKCGQYAPREFRVCIDFEVR